MANATGWLSPARRSSATCGRSRGPRRPRVHICTGLPLGACRGARVGRRTAAQVRAAQHAAASNRARTAMHTTACPTCHTTSPRSQLAWPRTMVHDGRRLGRAVRQRCRRGKPSCSKQRRAGCNAGNTRCTARAPRRGERFSSQAFFLGGGMWSKRAAASRARANARALHARVPRTAPTPVNRGLLVAWPAADPAAFARQPVLGRGVNSAPRSTLVRHECASTRAHASVQEHRRTHMHTCTCVRPDPRSPGWIGSITRVADRSPTNARCSTGAVAMGVPFAASLPHHAVMVIPETGSPPPPRSRSQAQPRCHPVQLAALFEGPPSDA